MTLTLLYRGRLSSCNYGCEYCPFAKKKDDRAELARDRADLEKLVAWIQAQRARELAVFFTPWGEALVRPAYQRAIARLSKMAHVRRVAIQTNLSAPLSWLEACEPSRVGIWATYHPGWARRSAFVAKVRALHAAGVSVSAGVVGLKEHHDEIERLRAELPAGVYVWINAAKSLGDAYYGRADVERFERTDPLFSINAVRHDSLGRACRTGESVVSVDGDGTVRRCHFVREPIGNLYEPGFDAVLFRRPCPNATCSCHIGYVHMNELGLADVFGEGLLERAWEWTSGRQRDRRTRRLPVVGAVSDGVRP